jgi:hypothetical protein
MNAISMITSGRKNTFSGKELTGYFRWVRYLYKTIITRVE